MRHLSSLFTRSPWSEDAGAEKALKLAIAEMIRAKRVSTRKVSQITEQLCGTEISASQVSRIAQLLDEELEQFSGTGVGGIPGGLLGCPLREGLRVNRPRCRTWPVLKAIGVNCCLETRSPGGLGGA